MIYRLGSLGDTILALPCFHKIHEAFPGANFIMLANKPIVSKAAPVEAVLGKGIFFSEVIDYPSGTRSFALLYRLCMQIRKMNIHTLVNIATVKSTSRLAARRDFIFFKLAGIKNIIGFPNEPRDFTLSIDPATKEMEWEAQRLVRRLAPLGEIDLQQEKYWDLKLTEAELSVAQNILSGMVAGKPVFAISAGTKMQAKDWGAENWVQFTQKLRQQFPTFNLVLIGSADEFEVSQACLDAWGGQGINLCGKISPRESAAVMQQAKLFIGHDSGPMHLAAAVGIPLVAIYSARNYPRMWYPRGDKSSIIYHKTDCEGCKLEVCTVQKKKCILSITVEEVMAAAISSINKYQPALLN